MAPETHMRLNCKADNIRALQEGLFGNAPKQWQTPEEQAQFLAALCSAMKSWKPWMGMDPVEMQSCDIQEHLNTEQRAAVHKLFDFIEE